VLHVCTCASHESYGSESSQKLLWVELLGSFQIKEHISLLDPFLHIVIMPKSSARFMWYCAFYDHADARPFTFRNKGGAMLFKRRASGFLSMAPFSIRKTIQFKGNVGRGWGEGGYVLASPSDTSQLSFAS
jgi:hypothetical protein